MVAAGSEIAQPQLQWWLILFLMCGSPLSFWFFLPFIRGEGSRETHYDLFACGSGRVAGLCGRAAKQKLGELDTGILGDAAATPGAADEGAEQS